MLEILTEEMVEEIRAILDELAEASEGGAPIIVEGPGDEAALHELGIKGKIFRISGSRRTALNFLERLPRCKEVVVMTDFDRAGDELAEFCAKHLKGLGSEPLVRPRERLKALVRKYVKDVKGLAKFLREQVGLER